MPDAKTESTPGKKMLPGCLLAVDAGFRTGLALYGANGKLVWYRSKNFGSLAALKRGAATMLRDIPGLTRVVVEGGGAHAQPWCREAARLEVSCSTLAAETWRRDMLLPRQQASGSASKKNAGELARRIIDWSGAPRPTSLRHDAAEAICLGLWAVVDMGWLASWPPPCIT